MALLFLEDINECTATYYLHASSYCCHRVQCLSASVTYLLGIGEYSLAPCSFKQTVAVLNLLVISKYGKISIFIKHLR